MKLSQMFAELAIETLEYLERIYQLIARKPQPQLTLLALNVDWFTHCNWREQLVAFKQMDIYRSNKH
jgi:hypothetical protein